MSDWGFFGDGLDGDPQAKALQAERINWLREKGWKLRVGWDRKAPLGNPEGTISHAPGHSLLDHLYRLVRPDGRLYYVTEPYWFYADGAYEIAALEGWHTIISSSQALWYPGQTIAIRMARER